MVIFEAFIYILYLIRGFLEECFKLFFDLRSFHTRSFQTLNSDYRKIFNSEPELEDNFTLKTLT